MKIRAVLFDMDGVLVDTERLHWRAYTRVLERYGVEVGIEEYRRRWIALDGGPEYACEAYRLPITADELRVLKREHYLELLRAGVQPMPGAHAALERLRGAYRLGLATNTARAETEVILAPLGLDTLLDAVVVREDYARPKPEPDAYLAAAATLQVAPGECVVIEDTQRGARAAAAAGMRAIALPNDLTFDNDFSTCALRLASLDELTREVLTGLEQR